ncbi:YbaN family protein [Noviherbaspirillum sp.]|uniref:YbaN family protein n=1 Tax=Noviherbaspirillum sp. TaxID=1926288 RepID=UPI002D719789|nr:YbaN family protein [Noviherbaspirillum sp.]HZW21547.1 YbaN family protein [Noviherbaspirillum sp.]
MKILLNIIGCIAVVLAILGIFLPLLPTTPFLLLASACFVRGSDRMHRWLRYHPVFGEYLRNFEDKRALPLRAKIVALVMLWVSMSYSIYLVRPLLLKIMLLAIATGVTVMILRLKTLEAVEAEHRPQRRNE